MEENIKELVGICGLYCGTCPTYLAPRDNDRDQLEQISRATGVPVEQVRCDGCLSDNMFGPCVECRHGFRKCAAEKGVTWCFQCDNFPCQRLEDFKDVHVVNGISHHAHVIEELRRMQGCGVEVWAKEQEKAGRCPQCGKLLYWSARQCPGCQARIR